MVVVGHWLDTIILVEDGQPVGRSALEVVGYMRWLTLLLQVMPMFFLAGGYAAAASWPSWRARGGHWAGWVHGRFVRLLRPTTWFVAIMAGVAVLAPLLRADPSVVDQAGWAVALQLWFLPVYLLMLLLAVPMIAVWNRVGWSLLMAAIALVAVVDVLVRAAGIPAAGWVNYLVAPAAGFALGIAWSAGALSGRGPIVLVVGGVLGLGADRPRGLPAVDGRRPGEPPANTSPPNLALMAYSAAQIGIVLLLERRLRRILEGRRAWGVVVRGNGRGDDHVPLAHGARAHRRRPPRRHRPADRPDGGHSRVVGAAHRLGRGTIPGARRSDPPGGAVRTSHPASPRHGRLGSSALLLACAGFAGHALFRLALDGFVPQGHAAVGPLLTYSAGVLALWLAGRPFKAPRPSALPIGS